MSRKSYVPNRLREATRYKVKMMRPYIRGRKAMDTARAWLSRDYSGIPSGLCFMADDFTMPVYWYVDDGHGWFRLVRGQCLICIDFRTLRILGFSLQPDKNYSAPVIHTLFTRVFTDWGVPRILYLERGIWESSRLITGGAQAKRVFKNWDYMPLSNAECSRGFGDLGVKFIHAYRARSKPVERVGGLVQDMMEREPGYCGRDERRDCPAITKARMDDVKFHRVHPSKYFYDQTQWIARLEEIFTNYNATPQEGKVLGGISPDAAQEQSQDAARAPLNFDLCRHLLAHFRIPVTVGTSHMRDDDRSNGITITWGNRKYIYRNEFTGRDKFQRKLAWWNPEEPSILAVTDLNMRNPYSVPLSKSVNALLAAGDEADAENYAEQLRLIEAHEAPGKTLYRTLRAKFDPLFRRVLPDRTQIETGGAIIEQRAAIEQDRQQTTRRNQRIRRNASEVGLPGSIVDSGADAEAGLKMMNEALRNQARQPQPPTKEET